MKLAAMTVFVVALTGCASATLDYRMPADLKVQSEGIAEKAFDEAWDQLIRNLSSDFFVINNLEKSSRIVNLSFTSDKPSEFVDCGRTLRTYNGQEFSYKTADSTRAFATARNGAPTSTVRQLSLSGRANVYLEPVDQSRTKVTANVRYIVSGQIREYNASGYSVGSGSVNWTFGTNKSLITADGVKCIGLGVLEYRLLKAADAL